MKTMSAREAKNAFGLMIDTARASPVLIEKHGRGVVVVVAVEEYERLTGTPKRRCASLPERTATVTRARSFSRVWERSRNRSKSGSGL